MSVNINQRSTKVKNRKFSKKNQKVAFGKLLTQMLFLLQSDNYFRPTGGGGYWFHGSRTGFYRPETACHEKIVLKIKSI